MDEGVKANYEGFLATQVERELASYEALALHEPVFIEAYARLISLNAWKHYLLVAAMNPDARGFFVEAQNDALVSLLLARKGMWRPSLQCLRSVIENVLAALYFKDHSVEYHLWKTGAFRFGFADLKQYFDGHPDVIGQQKNICGVELISKQYKTLSRAVHASGIEFRMNDGIETPVIYKHDDAIVGKWRKNQCDTLVGVNLLLTCIYREKLAGAAFGNIRGALGMVIPTTARKKIKDAWKVHI